MIDKDLHYIPSKKSSFYSVKDSLFLLYPLTRRGPMCYIVCIVLSRTVLYPYGIAESGPIEIAQRIRIKPVYPNWYRSQS